MQFNTNDYIGFAGVFILLIAFLLNLSGKIVRFIDRLAYPNREQQPNLKETQVLMQPRVDVLPARCVNSIDIQGRFIGSPSTADVSTGIHERDGGNPG